VHPLQAATKPAPPGIPGLDKVQVQVASENFPVALRVLPRAVRDDLLAVYGFARLTDDIGDRYSGDRLAALDWLEDELDAALHGHAAHPSVAPVGATVHRHDLDPGLFRDLIDANRRDQHQHRYSTFDELVDYCRLSANPVGRLVLGIFGVTDPRLASRSDDVCTALQIAEHLQDVGEDLAVGRIYLPQDDLATFRCTEDHLRRLSADPAVRRLIAFETERARTLLASGRPLLAGLPTMSAHLAVAGFVAGGLATLDAIAAADFDVLARRCRPTRGGIARHATALLLRSVRT
jgi:squalene synthase HpnC